MDEMQENNIWGKAKRRCGGDLPQNPAECLISSKEQAHAPDRGLRQLIAANYPTIIATTIKHSCLLMFEAGRSC